MIKCRTTFLSKKLFSYVDDIVYFIYCLLFKACCVVCFVFIDVEGTR